MVDLPTIKQRNIVTEAARSQVTAEAVAGPYRLLADALDKVGLGIKQVAAAETDLAAKVVEGQSRVVQGVSNFAAGRAAETAATARVQDALGQQQTGIGKFGAGVHAFVEGVQSAAEVVATRAGEKAVALGPDGLPRVETMPDFTGRAGRAYNRAAMTSYMTQLAPKVKETILEKRLEFANDPEGFKQWSQEYGSKLVENIDHAPLKAAVRGLIDERGGEAYRGLIFERNRRDISLGVKTQAIEITKLGDEMEIIARRSGTSAEGYTTRADSLKALLQEKVNNPHIAFPQAEADEFLSGVENRVHRAVIFDGLERVHAESGIEAARTYLRNAVGQIGGKLKNAEKIEREGMSWLRSEDAKFRGHRIAVAAEWRQMEPQATTMSREALLLMRDRASDVGAQRVVAAIETKMAALDLMPDFRALPASDKAFVAVSGVLPSRLTPEQQSLRGMIETEARRQGVDPALAVATAWRESKLNPAAANPTSTARGPFQLLAANRQAAGLSDDAPVQDQVRGGVAFLKGTVDSLRQSLGREPTAAEVYMGHFQGAGTAAAIIRAAPDASLKSVLDNVQPGLGDKVIGANKFLDGMSAGDFRNWAGRMMGGGTDLTQTAGGLMALRMMKDELKKDVATDLTNMRNAVSKMELPPVEDVMALGAKVHAIGTPEQQREVAQLAAIAQYGASFTQLSGPQRAEAISGWNAKLKEESPQYERALRDSLVKADSDIAGAYKADRFKAFYRFSRSNLAQPTPALDFDDPAQMQKVLAARGEQNKVIMAQEKLGPGSLLWPSEVPAFRGALFGSEPKRVGAAAGLAMNLLATDPHAFAGVPDKAQIEAAATTFRHYIDDLGMPAEKAAAKLIVDSQPEHQSGIRAKIKSEDVDDMLKKKLSVGEVEAAFDPSPLGVARNPSIGFTPRQRDEMFKNYAELVKEHYLDNGDLNLSKRLAQDQLKRVWGTTTISGSSVVMPYPPERAPGINGMENAGELIAAQAITAIASETGHVVTRDRIGIMAIEGHTASAFKNGQPTPYMLMWRDANDVPHLLRPGRAFVVDADTLRREQSDRREQGFRLGQERSAAESDLLGTSVLGAP